MNALIVYPDNILSYLLIKHLFYRTDIKVCIFFKLDKHKTKYQQLNDFFSDYGSDSILESKVKLIAGDFLDDRLCLNSNKYNKLKDNLDILIYCSDIILTRESNAVLKMEEICIKNMIELTSNNKFIYFASIPSYHYKSIPNNFESILKMIQKTANYKIYITSSILYLKSGYIETKHLLFNLFIKSFSHECFPVEYYNIPYNFIPLELIINDFSESFSCSSSETVLLSTPKSINIKDIMLMFKDHKFSKVKFSEWALKTSRATGDIIDYEFRKIYKLSNPFKVDKILMINDDLCLNNCVTYLQLNNHISFPPKYKKFIHLFIYLLTSSTFIFITFLILIYIIFKNKKFLVLFLLLTFLPIPRLNIITECSRRFIKLYMSCFNNDTILDGSLHNYYVSKNNYIFCNYPHDIFPFVSCSNLLCSSYYEKLKLNNSYIMANKLVFYVPIIKQLATFTGFSECSHNNIVSLLKKGSSIHIFLGGVDECIMNMRDEMGKTLICVNNRKGIFKIAIQNGIDIVPTYTFYNKRYLGTNNFMYIQKIAKLISNILPLNKTLCVIGTPIVVQKKNDPSDYDISSLKNKYISNLKELFDKYKLTFGWANKELTIF